MRQMFVLLIDLCMVLEPICANVIVFDDNLTVCTFQSKRWILGRKAQHADPSLSCDFSLAGTFWFRSKVLGQRMELKEALLHI